MVVYKHRGYIIPLCVYCMLSANVLVKHQTATDFQCCGFEPHGQVKGRTAFSSSFCLLFSNTAFTVQQWLKLKGIFIFPSVKESE